MQLSHEKITGQVSAQVEDHVSAKVEDQAGAKVEGYETFP